MTDNAELLPCPFCGGKVDATFSYESGRWDIYEVDCDHCCISIESPCGFAGDAAKQAAIAAWNTRAPVPASPPVVEDGLSPARPLIEAIACWERQHGTAAFIAPDEYEAFCRVIMDAAVKGSARAALSKPRVSREEIARVIDPVAFSEAYIGNRALLQGGGIYLRRADKREKALAKADAIIALIGGGA